MEKRFSRALAAATLSVASLLPISASGQVQPAPQEKKPPATDQPTATLHKDLKDLKNLNFRHLQMATVGVVAANTLITQHGPDRESCDLLKDGFALAAAAVEALRGVVNLEAQLGLMDQEKRSKFLGALDTTVRNLDGVGKDSQNKCQLKLGA